MSSKPDFKAMTTEELRVYVRHNDSEEAFDEYHSRLNWKTPPKFNSAEEEAEFIKDLIVQRTK